MSHLINCEFYMNVTLALCLADVTDQPVRIIRISLAGIKRLIVSHLQLVPVLVLWLITRACSILSYLDHIRDSQLSKSFQGEILEFAFYHCIVSTSWKMQISFPFR